MVKVIIVIISLLAVGSIQAEVSYNFSINNLNFSIEGDRLDLHRSVKNLEAGYGVFSISCEEHCGAGMSRNYSTSSAEKRMDKHKGYVESLESVADVDVVKVERAHVVSTSKISMKAENSFEKYS